VPARVSFEKRTKLRHDTKMAEVPLGGEAPWAGEGAETHQEEGEFSRQHYDYS
jgi:hypothetical protein